MRDREDGKNVTSPYRRFVNSQRRMHAVNEGSLKLKSTLGGDSTFHRDRNQSIGKAIKITETIRKGSNEDFPTPQKYKKPTIFDPEKAQIVKQGYRDGHKENPNKIINNNTKFRIFNEISPKDKEIAPLENLNDNPNKWKPRMTYYFRENQGDVTKPKNYKTERNYGYAPKESSRDARLGNSKRKLQNYMNLVNTDMRKLNKQYQERITSKSALTKLPEHTPSSYAVREMARNGPTNKTMLTINKLQESKNPFGKNKYSVPTYPILDVQKTKIVSKPTQFIQKDQNGQKDQKGIKRHRTLDRSDPKNRSYSTVGETILTPRNPNPGQFKQTVAKLELNDHSNFDKVGTVTYRDKNSKAVYPLNKNTNIKKQITSVYDRNKTVMREKYPSISPVFKPAIPRKIQIDNNPLKLRDTMNYQRESRLNFSPLYKSTKMPEFMDVLSLSRKLDVAARVGKND